MTIPSTNSKILITEDWKTLYQSNSNAEFQSYDFDTLKRVIISYLQENYPEDFNDFIDSSEYIALVDLISFLGQNLSFRIDLNARENFLETATRRDSILQLAQLVSYFPKRNVPASGLLKIVSISTTDNVFDLSGNNLANATIQWNDSTNANWYQQFISVFNSALQSPASFGVPADQSIVNGIFTQQYRINSSNTDVPVFGFSQNINGIPMSFEVVGSEFSGKSFIYEEPPKPGNQFSILYQNDNQGNSSQNTGFFCYFKQGTLGTSYFEITNPVSNEIIGVNINSINDTDLWLWQLGLNNSFANMWTQVPSVTGNNVIYNSLSASVRNFYSVSTQNDDRINLNFADGNFGNLPQGRFVLYYRQSNGIIYSIRPENMSGVVINIPYTNKSGTNHTLSLTLSLQYTVNNSSGPESNDSIRLNAPKAFYTQNRMITAEDYNIAPLGIGSEILKVKSVARVTSGISKYFDLSDVSGKYSKTNIFADDGIIYKNINEQNFSFFYNSKNDIYTVIKNKIQPILINTAFRSFYLDQYPALSLTSLLSSWVQVNKVAGQSRGYFSINNTPVSVGSFSNNRLSYVKSGALIKFVPPAGKYFLANGSIVSNKSNKTRNYIWATVVNVVSDGSNNGAGALSNGSGPITLNIAVSSSALPVSIIPVFASTLSNLFESEMVNLCLIQRNFGLSFDSKERTWNIIADTNLDLKNSFSLDYQNNVDNVNRDASWMIAFTWTGVSYLVRYRIVNYVFESENQTGFFVDDNSVNYDFQSNTVIKDQITVLSVNTLNTTTSMSLENDYLWQIDSTITQPDGYVEPKKVNVSFYDFNKSGQISDPETFNNIVLGTSVNSTTGYLDKFVYFQLQSDNITYKLIDSELFTAYPNPAAATLAISKNIISPLFGDLFYFYDSNYNVVNKYSPGVNNLNNPWIYSETESKYVVYSGRSNLKFQYLHNSSQETRIDPSKSNIIDVYLLTSAYDVAFRNWVIKGATPTLKPLPLTTANLENNYASYLEPIKAISDQMIFQSANYKLLFGSAADINLQAMFKVVQHPTSTLSSHDIVTKVLNAINNFFSLEYWDFGESFYFSELSTYVMNLLTPDITNLLIVPVSSSIMFGNFYEIACQSNEIFISCAAASDIQVISSITATQLNSKSTGSGS